MKLSAAQRKVLRQHRIYSHSTNSRTLDWLISNDMLDIVTEEIDGRLFVHIGIFTPSKKGRAALKDIP